ncbi:MAG: hypothetical protein WCA49_18155 [Candidatus Sulfotelmatobacter sp.]
MRIGLDHQALRLNAGLVATELSPRNIKLLLRGEASNVSGTRLAFQRLLVGQKRYLRAAPLSANARMTCE